jgi:hypothetical protein
MRLSLSPELWKSALQNGTVKSKNAFHLFTGLNAQTVDKLASGTFAPQAFEILGKYLTALGYTTLEVAEMRMIDLFDIFDDCA